MIWPLAQFIIHDHNNWWKVFESSGLILFCMCTILCHYSSDWTLWSAVEAIACKPCHFEITGVLMDYTRTEDTNQEELGRA